MTSLENTQTLLFTPPHPHPLLLCHHSYRRSCTAGAARSVTCAGGRAAERLAHQDVLNTTAGIAVKGDEGVLALSAGKNAALAGATLEALGKNGSVLLSAGENISLDTKKLQSDKDMTADGANYLRTKRGTELAAEIQADEKIKDLGTHFSPGETRDIYMSINLNIDPASLDEHYFAGWTKLAMRVHRDMDGKISFDGLAGDAYNFNLHKYGFGDPKYTKGDVFTDTINNAAWVSQSLGYLQPFLWTAEFQGTVSLSED